MLTIVVFFHELGHFLVARWAGVKVLTFSLGFGPELFGFNDRHGTRWKVSAIPLGGYVKFFGDESEACTPSSATLAAMTDGGAQGRASTTRRSAPRAAIVAAGPIANFILAIVIFAGHVHVSTASRASTARVDVVQENSAAAAAGFKPGDIVTAIDGKAIDSFARHAAHRLQRGRPQLSFTVKRGADTLVLTATPELKESRTFRQRARSACSASSATTRRATSTSEPVGSCDRGVARRRADLVHHRPDPSYIWEYFHRPRQPDQIGGPIRIAQISGQVATLGCQPLIDLLRLLSVSIGLAEPVSGAAARWRSPFVLSGRGGARAPAVGTGAGNGFRVGLGLVLMLMVFAIYNDSSGGRVMSLFG